MSETPYPSDQDELSDDDLAVLRAFDMAKQLAQKNPADPTIASAARSTDRLTSNVSDDMLVLFVTEADGEIAAMRQVLRELQQDTPDTPANSAHLVTLQRGAHKLKGTAGSIGYEHISTIARSIEMLIGQMKNGVTTHRIGLAALAQAVQALETTLYSVASEGRESDTPHAELEAIYDSLDVDVQASDVLESLASEVQMFAHTGEEIMPREAMASTQTSEPHPSMSVNGHDLEQLVLHVEELTEQHMGLERAQAEVESAQQELYTTQLRLQRLEMHLSTLHFADYKPSISSLVARILNESVRRTGHAYRRKNMSRPQPMRPREARDAWHWDELEMDDDIQDEVLLDSLREAITDIATASARMRIALEQLDHTLQKHMTQMALVRSDVLRLPHAHRTVRGLLVRAGRQRVVVPFSQVQRIDYEEHVQYDSLYMLNTLLGFPTEQVATETVRSVLILQQKSVAVQADEVLGEVEVLVKPLAAHLQRAGIVGTASDDIGEGNVLLVLDLPELVMRRDAAQQASTGEMAQSSRGTSQQLRTILIADDSLYIRQSVLHILKHAGYDVLEAHDGIEALEQLLTSRIDILLLDVEMPKLNGYDLLNIIRTNPQFARLKVVMMTSRSSEKHQRHAYELGAHGYLTKPCPQDTLLTIVRSLLS